MPFVSILPHPHTQSPAWSDACAFDGCSLNFRTRLSESIYLFFNNKRCYFAMQVATVPHKLGVDL